MSRLHIFDMDGTLLRGAASVELSRYLGCFEEADAVEQAWLRGEIGDVRFWELVLPMWEGISDEAIDRAFEEAPWIDGVRDVFADIAGRGEHSVVISQSPEFTVADKVTIADELMDHHGLVPPTASPTATPRPTCSCSGACRTPWR